MKKELIEIISQLVKQPTISPVGDEYLLQDYLTSLMTELNAKIKIISKDKKRPNIIGEIKGNSGKTLFLPIHMDVVPVGEGWESDPFQVVERGGYLYGRGVLDDKGPFAVVYLSVKKFIRDYPDFNGNIILAAVADEESDNVYGIKHLIKKGLKADAALVSDGGWIDQLDIGEKGCVQLIINSYGVQGHSAIQEDGNSAIHNLFDVVNAIRSIRWPKKFDKNFTPVKVNFSILKGGEYSNTIAPHASVQMDIRFPFGIKSKTILEQVDRAITELSRKDKKFKFKKEIVYTTEPHIVDDQKLIQSFLKAAKRANMPMRTITLAGNSVGKELTEAGIPSIVHWPTSEITAHEANERIKIKELLDSIDLYYEFLRVYFEIL